MSAAQAAQLAGGGSSETFAQAYANGAASADQTAAIASAKGGGLIAKAASVAVGALFSALTSVGGVVLQAIDATIPKVLAAGVFIQNDPNFGSPVMGSQTVGGFMSYTADGQGSEFGGTGITTIQYADTPADSVVTVTVNDVAVASIDVDGIVPDSNGIFNLGASGNAYGQSWVGLSVTGISAPITSAATIAPTQRAAHITGTTTVTAITLPVADFTGELVFYIDGASITIMGTVYTLGQTARANYDGSAWYMS
jgi:hypothetical protein